MFYPTKKNEHFAQVSSENCLGMLLYICNSVRGLRWPYPNLPLENVASREHIMMCDSSDVCIMEVIILLAHKNCAKTRG